MLLLRQLLALLFLCGLCVSGIFIVFLRSEFGKGLKWDWKKVSSKNGIVIGRRGNGSHRQRESDIFGVGGVGSWCAESLVRSGVSKLTLVDSDRICVTNVNRQLMATTKTVGQVKVEALKERLLDINPQAEIRALQQIYSEETADSFELDTYDYIVDAIDSLENKVHLIRTATRTPARFVSSMGAALKMDPTKINVAEFWKVKGCPLAAALRRRLKKGEKPAKKFLCVYSEELLENKGGNSACGTAACLCPKT
jgi:tRNA A37 threonylcarbamoyladenosine dehydratase